MSLADGAAVSCSGKSRRGVWHLICDKNLYGFFTSVDSETCKNESFVYGSVWQRGTGYFMRNHKAFRWTHKCKPYFRNGVKNSRTLCTAEPIALHFLNADRIHTAASK